ncbi:MAG: leucine-rich repeat domain-containing protein [Holosporales bacterium]|nr:leucine-rich repeat domain-containing protein [Holosporales bacterium]
MNRILLSKLSVLVSCFVCATQQQVVASSDASAPDQHRHAPFASTSDAPVPVPDLDQNENLVLFSATLSPESTLVLNEKFGDGYVGVYLHKAFEHFYDPHLEADDASVLNPSVGAPIVRAVDQAGNPCNAFDENWKENARTENAPSAGQAVAPDEPICATCNLFRIDIIGASVITKDDVSGLMRKINEFVGEQDLGYISKLDPTETKPLLMPGERFVETPPSLVNRCIFRISENTNIGEDTFFHNAAIRELLVLPTNPSVPDQPRPPSTFGEQALADCAYLQYAKIPDGICTIGLGAFLSCKHLAQVIMPGSIRRIDHCAFFNCCNLNTTMPDEVEYIGNEAFSCCRRLRTRIPSQLTYLGESAFFRSGLTEATIPVNITEIHKRTFESCYYLNSVYIHDDVLLLYRGAFGFCTVLTTVNIPDKVACIDQNAFTGCISLTSVNFGKGSVLKRIGEGAFAGCHSLTQIEIPNTVETIEGRTFVGCHSLASIFIGDGSQLNTFGWSNTGECSVCYECSPGLTISIPPSIRGLFTENNLRVNLTNTCKLHVRIARLDTSQRLIMQRMRSAILESPEILAMLHMRNARLETPQRLMQRMRRAILDAPEILAMLHMRNVRLETPQRLIMQRMRRAILESPEILAMLHTMNAVLEASQMRVMPHIRPAVLDTQQRLAMPSIRPFVLERAQITPLIMASGLEESLIFITSQLGTSRGEMAAFVMYSIFFSGGPDLF